MSDLVVLVPSRGRPEAVRTLAAAFEATCRADTQLVFAVDDNDPTLDEYVLADEAWVRIAGSRTMNEALNAAAVATAGGDETGNAPFAIAFMGDDHLPRTAGWDAAYLDALRGLGTGIVYGDDLMQGRTLPTQCAMTSDIVRALGYMAPPVLTHLWLDNFWLSLGNKAGCIKYLPDVIVEHRHPMVGKAAWDEGYERVNALSMQDRDEAAFEAYLASNFAGDVDKVQALRGDRFIEKYARPGLVVRG